MAVEQNVLIFTFPQKSIAFQALSELKAQPGVENASIVERTEQGELRVADTFEPGTGSGPFVGGAVGALIGILGGPLGVLLGWSAGTVVGGLNDVDDAGDSQDGLAILSRRIAGGTNALLVEMEETSPAIADDLAHRLDGQLVRVPVTEVDAEIEAARKAADEAAKAARKARREQHRSQFNEKVHSIFGKSH